MRQSFLEFLSDFDACLFEGFEEEDDHVGDLCDQVDGVVDDDDVPRRRRQQLKRSKKAKKPEPEKEKKLSIMEAFHKSEGERAACMTFCRDTITRLADGDKLQKAQIETLLADRVSLKNS